MAIPVNPPKPETYGYIQAKLPEAKFEEIKQEIGNDTKQYHVYESVFFHPAIQTSAITALTTHGNVHKAVDNMNEKLKKFNLKLKSFKRDGVPHNADFYHWYLIYIDASKINEAANDSTYSA